MLSKEEIEKSYEEYQEYEAFLASQDLPLPSFQLCRKYISAFPLLWDDKDAHETDRLCFEEHGVRWQFLFSNPSLDMDIDFVTDDVAASWNVSAKELVRVVHENLKQSLRYVGYKMLFGKAGSITIPFIEISYMCDTGAEWTPVGSSLILSRDIAERCCGLLGTCTPVIIDQESIWVLPMNRLKKSRLDPVEACEAILKDDPSRKPQFYQVRPFFSKTSR